MGGGQVWFTSALKLSHPRACHGGCRSGTNLDREGVVRGQTAKRPDPPSWGMQCLQKRGHKSLNAREIKGGPATGLCDIDDIGGHTKPDQYGRSVCRLGYGSARASSRQAFLTAGGASSAHAQLTRRMS